MTTPQAIALLVAGVLGILAGIAIWRSGGRW